MAESINPEPASTLFETEKAAGNAAGNVFSLVHHHTIIQNPGPTTYPTEVLVQPIGCTWLSSAVSAEVEDNTGMRAVVQRVTQATVTVAGEVTGQIERGVVVLLGVARNDTEKSAEYLAAKV